MAGILDNPVGANPVLQVDPNAQGFKATGPGILGGGPGFVRSDDGIKLNIAPQGMTVPEWGRGLTWGLSAYRYDKGTPALMIRDARLPPDMQGQGLGTAMYQEAIKSAFGEGRRFQSDGSVTQDAVNVWSALKRMGYDVQTSGNHKFTPGPPEAPHLSRFETKDGSPLFWIDPPSK